VFKITVVNPRRVNKIQNEIHVLLNACAISQSVKLILCGDKKKSNMVTAYIF